VAGYWISIETRAVWMQKIRGQSIFRVSVDKNMSCGWK